MKKKFIILIAVLFVSLFFYRPIAVEAKEKDGGLGQKIEEQLEKLDTTELEKYLESLSADQLKLFGGASFKERVRSVISGDFKIGYESFSGALLNLLFSQVKAYLPIFSGIAAICILCGILSQLKPSFLGGGTGEVIFFVSYAAVILLVAGAMFALFAEVKNSITALKTQMDIAFPILLTLMAASGGTVSVAVYKPAVAFLSGAIVQIIYAAVLPLTLFITVFSIVGNMSSNVKLNRFIDLFKSANKWIIGMSLTIFSVFLSVQGIAAASYDGISIRAAKYAISNSVPIVGGFLSGGFDLLLAGSSVIKNAVGGGAVILALITIIMPVISIAAFSLFMKLTAAVTEPLGDGRISSLLSSLSGAVNYLTAALLAVGFMYFISMVLLICSSNSFF